MKKYFFFFIRIWFKLLKIEFKANFEFNTTIYFYIKARRNCVEEKQEDLVCSTKMLFVHIDEDGKPKKIDI